MEVVRSMVGLALMMALTWASAAEARVVKFQTSSPLPDRSDRSIEQALERAVDTCVRGATAMGLSSIRLDDAAVRSDRVVVRMIATDEDAEDEEVQVHDLTPRTMTERPL
jgi:hypothetical protein